ncbi:MAG TPA: COX15/CtaA family protein [Thermoanaerobaculia bacterium]|nr:COX15/CtaA family protein [Thermoanaerobaculia bacterium]
MDRFARYSWLTLACNVLVVLWGTAVRATGSGAGCGSHWPLCNGEVIPHAPRIDTLIELSHRVTSGLALLLVVGLVWMAFRHRPKGHAARTWAVWSLVFMVGEAAVGAGLVLFELVADNQSVARALFMGTHLLNTFFLLAALTLTARAAGGGADFSWRGVWHAAGLPGAGLWPGLLGLLLAGMSGAIAALGDTLFPSMTLDQALTADFSPAAHLLIRLRILHPVIAVAAGLYVAWMGLQLFKRHLGPEVALFGRLTAGLVFFQICAGVINVALLAPIWMQIVHLLLADLLWIAFVMLSAAVLAARAMRTPGASAVGALTPPETARA